MGTAIRPFSNFKEAASLLLFFGQSYQSLCFLVLFAVNTLFASVRPKKFYEMSRPLLGRAYPRRQCSIQILLGGLFTWIICQSTMFESEILVLSKSLRSSPFNLCFSIVQIVAYFLGFQWFKVKIRNKQIYFIIWHFRSYLSPFERSKELKNFILFLLYKL